MRLSWPNTFARSSSCVAYPTHALSFQTPKAAASQQRAELAGSGQLIEDGVGSPRRNRVLRSQAVRPCATCFRCEVFYMLNWYVYYVFYIGVSVRVALHCEFERALQHITPLHCTQAEAAR